MARVADKPGTYRVRQKASGGWFLSGVKRTGERIRVPVSSEFEGVSLARTLFDGAAPLPASTGPTIPEIIKPGGVDDWGLPVVTAEQSASIAGAMGVPPPSDPTKPVVTEDPKIKETLERRKKTARSMMELVGHGYAVGVVMGSTRFVKSTGREPVKPSPKQVTDLSECTKDTLAEMFGDHEVKPWIMMVLLTIGIPLSMWIQSPKAPKPVERSESQENRPNLSSV